MVTRSLTQPLLEHCVEEGRRREEEALRECGVECFPGFMETTYRLVFAYEDRFKSTPKLYTILPNGTLENKPKLLEPNKKKGLFAYAYPQSIKKSAFEQLLSNNPDCEKKSLEHFVWKRNRDSSHDSLCLVQAWSMKYDDTFKRNFRVYPTNPAPHLFDPQAVDAFRKAMENLFGAEERIDVKFAVKAHLNKNPIYKGLGHKLLYVLKEFPRIKESFKIVEVTEKGFTAIVVEKGKDPVPKQFDLCPETISYLYTKNGCDTMACIKAEDQFKREASVPPADLEKNPIIPCVLLAAPLPWWSYDSEVVRLFFNDQKLICPPGIEVPRPLPMDSCVGPALRWARWRALVLWMSIGYTGTFGLLVLNEDMLYARYIYFHRTVFIFVLLFGLWAEFNCVRYFIVPYVERLHGCHIPLWSSLVGKPTQSFELWLTLMSCCSCLSMLNIQTNAEVVLETLRQEYKTPNEIPRWTCLMEFSMFGGYGIDWERLSPGTIAFVAWLISTMQFFLPLLRVQNKFRSSEPELKHVESKSESYGPYQALRDLAHYAIGMCTAAYEPKVKYIENKSESYGPYEALRDLAYASGMCTIGASSLVYPLAYINDAIMNDEVTTRSQNWDAESVRHLKLAQNFAINRLFIDGLVKKCLQLKVQVTLYSLNRSLSGSSSVCALVQILVTLLVGLASQIDTVLLCLTHYHKLKVQLRKSQSSQYTDYGELLPKTLMIGGLGLLILVTVGYSCSHLYNVHACPTSLWNLGGCVPQAQLDSFLERLGNEIEERHPLKDR